MTPIPRSEKAMPRGLPIGICSFSFHHMLAAGRQDMFQYIATCKELGCTQLDPWNAHLADLAQKVDALHAGRHPEDARLSAGDDAYIARVRAAAEAAELPFGCIAVDGAHIYEADPDKRAANRRTAYRWLDIADRLGARQVRIDAGGPADMPDAVLATIVEGYRDLIARARDRGMEILVENHWGPTPDPDNVERLLRAVDGLGLLFDTNNWAKGRQEEGWRRCARYARACHVKTFGFDAQGNDPSVNLALAIRLLREAGYAGCWGVESYLREPAQTDEEIEHARRTIALILREVRRAPPAANGAQAAR